MNENINFSNASSQKFSPKILHYQKGGQKHNDVDGVVPERQQDSAKLSKRNIINANGIHNPGQIVLVIVLILVSIVSVSTNNGGVNPHVRYLSTFCNYNILGNTYTWIYEDGQNIDQPSAEFVFLPDMISHIQKFVASPDLYQQEAVINFTTKTDQLIVFELYYQNETIQLVSFSSVKQATEYFHFFEQAHMKNLFLNLNAFKILIQLGQNKLLTDFKIIGFYQFHSKFMLSVDVQYEYETQLKDNDEVNSIRVIEQLLALILLGIYCKRMGSIMRQNQDTTVYQTQYRQNNMQDSQAPNFSIVRQKFRNWYVVLSFLCLVTLFNTTFAPLCSFLQILPIFEFPNNKVEPKHFEIYNFNKNLRFSFLLVLTIYFPMFIFLNGFIFYSMIMYPGEYFDDYLLGFCSYVYQMFQVGTYEIFTQVETYGNFAYMIYAILYFYVFMVGNSLIPALFVVLIQMKITEHDVKAFVLKQIQYCICPQCSETNGQNLQNHIQINIQNHQLSPLISLRRLKQENSSKDIGNKLVVFIESPQKADYEAHMGFQISKTAMAKVKLLKDLLRKIQQLNDQSGLSWKQDCLKKIQCLRQGMVGY